MSESLQPIMILTLVRVLIGLLAYGAILSGLEDWLGLNWLLAAIVALPVALVPIVGPIVGIMGAIVGWGWEWYWAVLLFWWPIAFAFCMMFFESVQARFKTVRS